MKRAVEALVLPVALIGVALIGATMVAPAHADDVSDGQSLARQWCASCHVVGRESQQVVNGAPAFSFMARNPQYTAERLEAWLLLPQHPAMQGIDLSRTQIRQVRAYIESLKN